MSVFDYCMGGLEIGENSPEAIRGLPGRSSGHYLLDCVVFGRAAGAACAKNMLGDRVKATSLAELSNGCLSGNEEVSRMAGGS